MRETSEVEAEVKRSRLNYENKVILAPMVRIGTLPMRLLALDYGADIVYTEELIDWKLLRSVRRQNDVLGTIDYIDRTDGTIVFRTCAREREHVVLQLGTCDAGRALKVAQLVENDVAGVDVNMGCPKRFSLLGGMGAALLRDPNKARAILTSLVGGLSIPVTCKVRVLPGEEETLALCEKLASSGIAAITVHGRTVTERPQHPNRNSMIQKIARHLEIPVIANGGSKEIEKYSDIARFKSDTGCSSVMIARAAEWNCSIFRSKGMLPMEEVIRSYLKLAVDYDNSPSNTKYCVQNILRDLQESPLGRRFLDTQTLEQICKVWDMDDYCRKKLKEYREKGYDGRFEVIPERLALLGNKRKLEDESEDVFMMRCAFLRSNYTKDTTLPKTQLAQWTQKNRKKLPAYNTINEDKLFRSVVTVDGRKYGSSFWEKNKKWAEQGAALVCLCALGMIDEENLKKNGHIA
ncbi:tRNA-dihydrouridine(20) synthase [NAD(P)+]-like [Copidosoma floridanum]|uniref:tRNA-dihydrouridine(20) synthase [NAD(P)+]-like n=1 Tax=Copidosoma floridanum TaxID=29053 RepID=UPI0006C9B4F4|nr:tRNA-dihydrouridine(20) synthase [NAD(P)+]-like [Copidosoma floridanum]XP_014207140.1 tRNA-dihydrouridine(20) synthase [NAD(P)+]-like [Copidosoma floridanum]